MTQTYVRKDKGIVNADLKAYQAAKKRREREKHIDGLEQRINRLEEAFIHLEKTLHICKREEQL
jgi:uncharacterized protein (DUF3084 family)|tara:strand:+ start:298 stop:489 length:192 start_codon:yes stop_codon:yes gene_type:complete